MTHPHFARTPTALHGSNRNSCSTATLYLNRLLAVLSCDPCHAVSNFAGLLLLLCEMTLISLQISSNKSCPKQNSGTD
ncbi:MAG: hypothetical protein EBY32_12660 [Proteobacteria bacterium]|nr:hypothetical protein [Pseudomonadota bacterium]